MPHCTQSKLEGGSHLAFVLGELQNHQLHLLLGQLEDRLALLRTRNASKTAVEHLTKQPAAPTEHPSCAAATAASRSPARACLTTRSSGPTPNAGKHAKKRNIPANGASSSCVFATYWLNCSHTLQTLSAHILRMSTEKTTHFHGPKCPKRMRPYMSALCYAASRSSIARGVVGRVCVQGVRDRGAGETPPVPRDDTSA